MPRVAPFYDAQRDISRCIDSRHNALCLDGGSLIARRLVATMTVAGVGFTLFGSLNTARGAAEFRTRWVARREPLRPLGDRRSVGKLVMLRSGSANALGLCKWQLLLHP